MLKCIHPHSCSKSLPSCDFNVQCVTWWVSFPGCEMRLHSEKYIPSHWSENADTLIASNCDPLLQEWSAFLFCYCFIVILFFKNNCISLAQLQRHSTNKKLKWCFQPCLRSRIALANRWFNCPKQMISFRNTFQYCPLSTSLNNDGLSERTELKFKDKPAHFSSRNRCVKNTWLILITFLFISA